MFAQVLLPVVLSILCCFPLVGRAFAQEIKQPLIDQGRTLYLTYGCAVCHGKEGTGDGIGGKNMHPPPTNLHQRKEYMHGSKREDIVFSIKAGVRDGDSIMPSFAHLTPDEIEAISHYVVSLQDQ